MQDSCGVAGIRITHPDRVLYPDLGLTKRDLATYVERVTPWMLPHVEGRPLTLVRCGGPVGTANCVYLRHAKAWGPSVLRRVNIREKTKIGEYLVADTPDALVGLVQMGVVEIHTWNARAGDIERPDRIVWDFDPGPDVGWPAIVRAARAVRDLLHDLDLESWVKTTGGRGLHLVVPIVPSLQWDDCLAFSRWIAEMLEAADPARYTTAFPKRGREAKILIDFMRNNRTNTSIAAFSARARPGAAVSMPVAWESLGRTDPSRFTIASTPDYLRRRSRDPWAGYFRARQRLSKAALRGAGLAIKR
jgi:bifunctional non-homologous end joining protein LigD